MHAYLAVMIALMGARAHAAPSARDRSTFQREIDAASYNQVPKFQDYILSDDFLAAQKNRVKLVTKVKPEEAVAADNVILESNSVRIVKPARRKVATALEEEQGLVRHRRGYNLENVNVPARYPYLPVPSFYRFRRWG